VKRSTKAKPRRKPRAATGQNWAERMEAARLHHMADQILGIPPTYGAARPSTALFDPPRDAPLPALLLADIERWRIADYLRSLTKPRVVRALRRAQPAPAKRGRKTDGARLWRAALHLEISTRRRRKLTKEVAHAWGLSKSRLYEISRLSEKSGKCELGDWRYWAAYELRKFRFGHRDIRPRARRAAFIKELRAVR
jgi:hypothetical protein